jgi:dUTP pyrophosphatase
MRLEFTRLDPAAIAPTRAYSGDAGFDLYAITAARIEPGTRTDVGTGIALAIPDGHAGLVLPRSGLAIRHGIALVNAPGLIDAGYRGELRVLLLNTDREETFEVAPGDRIAQLVIVSLPAIELHEQDQLEGSERGDRGLGSSGTRQPV